ncbi:M57 family metalloprotease [Fulvivirga ligni]|uniref:M57 family metalloprotease n=1 Tax=Fulvivirga ligni TaxID=2904246 RepID=UPI001F3A3FC5|nr:M57 family metalloprotease [Fulvivirga ligni]UII23565.1 zinc-dependent metalloprotease [Fulvivirga ligni]
MIKVSLKSGLVIVSLVVVNFIFSSCSDPAVEEPVMSQNDIPESIIKKLEELHFDTSDIMRHGDDYLVEGDMVFSEEMIDALYEETISDVNGEHYYSCTAGIVSHPRVITIRGYSLNSTMNSALNLAISRYNALGLEISFLRVTGAADITVYSSGSGAGGVAGFPSGGNPYPYINVLPGTTSYGMNVTTHVMVHEIGHSIGIRHTDWFNRSYSCGSGGNEGDGGVGACHVPGTPTTYDSRSVFLSCFSANATGQFSYYDEILLHYLY